MHKEQPSRQHCCAAQAMAAHNYMTFLNTRRARCASIELVLNDVQYILGGEQPLCMQTRSQGLQDMQKMAFVWLRMVTICYTHACTSLYQCVSRTGSESRFFLVHADKHHCRKPLYLQTNMRCEGVWP